MRRLAGRPRRAAAALMLVVAVLATACGGGDDEEALEAVEFEPISADGFPDTVLDLRVAEEQASTPLRGDQQPYIDGLGFFSFRRGDDVLQATLQVNHFTEEAKPEDPLFRLRVAAGVGAGAAPTPVRVGDQEVFLLPSGRQTIAVWFEGENMFVLSIRAEYSTPRSLLRAVTELEVEA